MEDEVEVDNEPWEPPIPVGDFKAFLKDHPLRSLCSETDKHNRKQVKKKLENRKDRNKMQDTTLFQLQDYISKISEHGRCFDYNNKKAVSCTCCICKQHMNVIVHVLLPLHTSKTLGCFPA